MRHTGHRQNAPVMAAETKGTANSRGAWTIDGAGLDLFFLFLTHKFTGREEPSPDVALSNA